MMMTQSYASGPSSGSESTGQAVREQAANVGQGAAQAGGQVARTAQEQTREVVRETGAQARNLVNEARGELGHQTSMQQKRAAEGLRALGSELRSMAGKSEQQEGVAADLVQQAADRAHRMADWLEHREPGQVLDEVRRFARRRPGVFMVGALAAGVVVGRLARSLATSGGQDATPASTQPPTTAGMGTVSEPVEPTLLPATGLPTTELPGDVTDSPAGYPETGYRGTGYPGEVRP